MEKALARLQKEGGDVLYGGEVLRGGLYDAGTYVTPCLAAVPGNLPLVREETS